MEITPENLMAKIFEAQFERPFDAQSDLEKALFFNSLKETLKSLEKQKISTVTKAAIKAWIYPPKNHPTRGLALKFLGAHVHGLGNGGSQTSRDAITALRRYLGVETAPAPSAKPTAGHIEGPAKRWRSNLSTWEIAKSLKGTYQIIRPSAYKKEKKSSPEIYVLEALAIDPDFIDEMIMYSHTQPKLKYLYRGNIDISMKYLFSLIRRQHEYNPELEAFRTVALYIYDARHCLSGIMLRGVTGRTGNRAVGVPFIAIKTPVDTDTLVKNPPEIKRGHIYHIKDNLIIGEIQSRFSSTVSLFSFCDRIFKALHEITHGGGDDGKIYIADIIHAVDSKLLCDNIGVDVTVKNAFFYDFIKAVEGCDWEDPPLRTREKSEKNT